MMLYNARSKSVGVAYMLWLFLGQFGAHRFYMGKVGSGLAWLALLICSVALTVVLIGFLGLLAIGVWWIIDGVLLVGMVREHNERLAYEV